MSADGDRWPDDLAPMLATSTSELPRDQEAWSFEFKWDGVRILAFVGGPGGVELRLESRSRADVTRRYPELIGLPAALGRSAVLDGEMVALGPDGRPDFGLIQHRLGSGSPGVVSARAAAIPAVFFVFDVLFLDGRSLLDVPLAQRRAALDSLSLAGPGWRTPPAFAGEGDATLEAARGQDLEGVIAKRQDSVYTPGRRSTSWRKLKLVSRDDFVVGGWSPGAGRREGSLGSLLVGSWEPHGDLRYRGRVGSGFTGVELDRIGRLLAKLRRPSSPFAGPVGPAPVTFVEPVVLVEVAYRETTAAGTLRHPVYKGIRADRLEERLLADWRGDWRGDWGCQLGGL